MEKRRALDIDRYTGLLLVNTANTLISLDIDRDCLELGELSVRIHHQAGGQVCCPPILLYLILSILSSHWQEDMRTRSSLLSWEQSSDANLGHSRETRAKSEELRSRSR